RARDGDREAVRKVVGRDVTSFPESQQQALAAEAQRRCERELLGAHHMLSILICRATEETALSEAATALALVSSCLFSPSDCYFPRRFIAAA
ncbi:hypothetical protein SKAU_G00149110, partial [Synaphobranchus kaupii]